MLCKDVMLFDENMKVIPKPDFEKCSVDDFEEIYFNAHYIFIDGKKALKEWNEVYNKFVNCYPNLFELTGAYARGLNPLGGWSHIMTEISALTIVKNRLQAAYVHHSRLPLQGLGGEEL